ncbi:MAG TPA: response regulator [Pirellulales bacterium]|jgi:response regulator NasT|nr:response regulator [Pirellulales bacterium]
MIFPPLRVIAADDDRSALLIYGTLLPKLGHEISALVSTGDALVKACRELTPDLVITDIKMPDMEGVEAVLKAYEFKPFPVIFVSGVCNPKTWEPALTEQIAEFLIKPITLDALREKIDRVMQLYEQFEFILREYPLARAALRHRKMVERAKALLMRGNGISDEQAFEQLRDVAEQQGQSITIAAQRIVSATEATTG